MGIHRLSIPPYSKPKAWDDEPPSQPMPAPAPFTVDYERKPILYLPDGRVLVKRSAGFVR